MSDDQSKRYRGEEEQGEGEESRESGGESGGEESSTGGVQLARQPQATLQSDGDQEAETQPRAEDANDQSKSEEGGQGTSVQTKREERMRRLRELHLRRVRVQAVVTSITSGGHFNNKGWSCILLPIWAILL